MTFIKNVWKRRKYFASVLALFLSSLETLLEIAVNSFSARHDITQKIWPENLHNHQASSEMETMKFALYEGLNWILLRLYLQN